MHLETCLVGGRLHNAETAFASLNESIHCKMNEEFSIQNVKFCDTLFAVCVERDGCASDRGIT